MRYSSLTTNRAIRDENSLTGLSNLCAQAYSVAKTINPTMITAQPGPGNSKKNKPRPNKVSPTTKMIARHVVSSTRLVLAEFRRPM